MNKVILVVLTFCPGDEFDVTYPMDPVTSYVLRNLPQYAKESIMWYAEARALHFPETERVDYSEFDGVMMIVVHRWRLNPLPYPVDPYGPKKP